MYADGFGTEDTSSSSGKDCECMHALYADDFIRNMHELSFPVVRLRVEYVLHEDCLIPKTHLGLQVKIVSGCMPCIRID